MDEPSFFNLDFWQQFITTALGVALGIPVAMEIERRLDKQRDAEDCANLISGLRHTLEKNLALVDQLILEFKERGELYCPLYPMDLVVLDATTARRFELIGDPRVMKPVEHARFELAHLNEKLRLMRDCGPSTDGWKFFPKVKGSAALHLPIVQNAIKAALEVLPADTRGPSWVSPHA